MAIDLFAGAGGLSLGLIQAGITVVAAVEWDHDACATYRRNIGDHVIERAIEEISPDELPDADLIAGGPPCQGFSTAGKRDPNDPRNRLWREYLRIVAAKRPAYILVENVRGMLSAGEDKTLILAFAAIGYRVTPYLCNTADYGIPQTRTRVFYVGNRVGGPNPCPSATHAQPPRHLLLDLLPWVTVRQALRIGQEPLDPGDVTYEPFGGVTPEMIRDAEPMLGVPANTIRANGRSGRALSRKHPGHFLPVAHHGVLELDSPSRTIKAGNNADRTGHRGGALPPSIVDLILDSPAATIRSGDGAGSRVDPTSKRPYHLIPVLDEPSATITAGDGGAVTSPRRRHGGFVPDALPNIPLDRPSPTILGCNTEASGHTGGAEPVRHRLKNRIAANRNGSTIDEPAPSIMAEHPLEEHWLEGLYDTAPTIQGDPRVSVPGHHGPGEPRMTLRRLTPRECATLQDFPPDFEFTGTKTSQHRQIGNAVPPGMARALGESIRAAFEASVGS